MVIQHLNYCLCYTPDIDCVTITNSSSNNNIVFNYRQIQQHFTLLYTSLNQHYKASTAQNYSIEFEVATTNTHHTPRMTIVISLATKCSIHSTHDFRLRGNAGIV